MSALMVHNRSHTDLAKQECRYGDSQLVIRFAAYVSVAPFIIGFPGNIMIILVATRKHNLLLSPCIYMTAMAVADTVLLLTSVIFQPLYYGTTLMKHSRAELCM